MPPRPVKSATARATRPAADEIELKLRLPDGADAVLPVRPLLKGVPARRVRLDAIYFDTVERLLHRHRMALRLRRSGRQWLQTLKAEGRARGGLSARPEWESPAKLLRGQPRLDRARMRDSPLPALLAGNPRSGPLRPVFRVRVTRTLWELAVGRSRIEVAMDRGTIEAQRNGRRVTEPVAELELELKEGRADDLLVAALRLAGTGKAALALVPIRASKAERGYRLVDGKPRSPTKAAARGFVEALTADMAAGVALRAIVAHGLDVLLSNTDGLRDAHDPEFVHQARVAMRRMRSAIRLLDRKHADFPEALAKELRWVGQLLGAARDWDVLTGQTLPALLAGAPQELAPTANLLLERATARRDAARAAAAAALATPRYARLALRLQQWALSPAPKGRSLARLAARTLDKAHQRLFGAAQFFAALSPERRHRVRILAKRLRYSLDVMSVALPKQPTERYVAALSELQDVLGDLNDAAVAVEAMAGLAATAESLALLRRTVAQYERNRLVEAESLLLSLLESARPWKP